MTGNISTTSKFEPFFVVFWPRFLARRKERFCLDWIVRCRWLSLSGVRSAFLGEPPLVLSEGGGPPSLPRLRSDTCRVALPRQETALALVLVRYSSFHSPNARFYLTR